MSSDPLDRNLGDLIRRGALPLDDARSARARERFLEGVTAPPERTSWKIAAAAAAALVVVTLVWSARVPQKAPVVPPVATVRPERPETFLGHGGDKNLQGLLRRRDDRIRFEARSPLPDGLEFKIRAERLEIQEQGRLLQLEVASSLPGSATLLKGVFDFEWPHKVPGKVRLLVSAPDDLQDVAIVRQLRELKIPEAERQWTFEYCAWDNRVLAQLGPQLEGVTDLSHEVEDLVVRVSQACDFQQAFETQKKGFIKEAEKLQARAEGMAASGLFPEASRRVAYTARDLAQAMAIFTWDKDKFTGPRSYYTNGEKAKTHRNDPFELKTLHKYLDEAVFVGGREFGLWILEEYGREGPRPEFAHTVRPHAKRPGLSDVAERLGKIDNHYHAVDVAKLVQELRRLP
jgi:hypothetical protein